MTARTWAFVAASIFLAGCGGHGTWSTDPIVLTQPQLKLRRNDVALAHPLLIAVVDEQANEGVGDYSRTRGNDYAAALTAAMVSAYPNAIKPAEAPAGGGSGNAFIQIRIHKLGAYVNRSGAVSLLGAVRQAGGNIGDWAQVVTAAADSEPTISGSHYVNVANNWSGVANLEVFVVESAPAHAASFHFPLVAERVTPNDFGMLRAWSIADSAWDAVAARLGRFLDAAVAKLAAEERTAQASGN